MTREQALSPIESEQYGRHLTLPGFGVEKQLRLKQAKVLIVGAGGLGCPVGLYLAASGVGTIGVADFDRVERSNLQRQVAHSVEKIGALKTDSLIAAMRTINPLLQYRAHAEKLAADNVGAIIAQYDLVLDGTDNFATRFLLADACYLCRVPLLQAAVYAYEAQLALFLPDETACYRCVFEEPPAQNALASCVEVGVLGVVPGTAGLMMATEAVKFLTGLPGALQGDWLIYDALRQSIRRLPLVRNADCPLCGKHPRIREIAETLVFCPAQRLFGADFDAANAPAEIFQLSVEEAKQALGVAFTETLFVLDVREAFEFRAGHLPDATHFPLSALQTSPSALSDILPDNVRILVYCQKGMRSLEAVRRLRALGYDNAVSLSGGLNAWDGPVVVPV